MPPLRTFVPVKTERTHEENQERAYIAASRRNDRSLEARVESARRASEIHKRRTGRSLRVTEEDVLNEEMYEEEDDDLPSQYRRLTAHLQTGSADFNRRLAAYLTNHVAMRSALDQAITASYAQQFPDAPQYAHNQLDVFPSPFQDLNSTQASPQASSSQSHRFRHSPYPLVGMPGYRGNHRNRTASFSVDQGLENVATEKGADASATSRSDARRASVSGSKLTNAGLELDLDDMSGATLSQDVADTSNSHIRQFFPSFSPFTTTLPPDTQQLVGPALDPTDPFTSSLMAGSDQMSNSMQKTSFYNYVPKDLEANSAKGINSTLAPPAPASSQEDTITGKDESARDNSAFNFVDIKGEPSPNTDTEAAFDAPSPGVEAWEAFIDDSSWTENVS